MLPHGWLTTLTSLLIKATQTLTLPLCCHYIIDSVSSRAYLSSSAVPFLLFGRSPPCPVVLYRHSEGLIRSACCLRGRCFEAVTMGTVLLPRIGSNISHQIEAEGARGSVVKESQRVLGQRIDSSLKDRR